MKRLSPLLVLVAVAACADDTQVLAPFDPLDSPQVVELTPLQASLQQTFANRASDGLPTPEFEFAYSSNNGATLGQLQQYQGAPGESFTLVATTTIRFDGPAEAGLERWPSAVVRGEVADGEGTIREGDYDDEVRDFVRARIPGYWDRHDFGYEPRTRTIVETITVTYGEPDLSGPAYSVVDDDLVHGFTFVGPDIDWTVRSESCIEEAGIEVCAWKFRAGFAMDWGFGMRLPMNVSLAAADAVNEGDTFTPTSMADGANWSAADFTAAGIAPESGNEFAMRYEFFLGVQVEVAETTVIDIGPDIDKNASSSFKTPFGPGAVFDLPAIDVPLLTRSLAAVELEFGASFTPQAGSDRFRADWMASSGLLGNGSLTYTDPSDTEELSSVFAADGPNLGNLQIRNSKYVFNQYKIALGAYFSIDIFGLFDDRYPIPITDFDLSNLIPDVSVPIHAGSSPTVLNSGVTVNNVAPTAVISVGGAQIVNGENVFFADVDEAIPFQATSHDPGLDDLLAVWNFGDGTPGVSTGYPLPAAATMGPNNVTDDQPHAYVLPCTYPVTFSSTDSDGASNSDSALALVRTAASHPSELGGYWQHQLRGNGGVDFDDDTLACMLSIVGAVSTVFHESNDVSTVEAAAEVVRLNGNGGTETQKLDRALLVAWMNFANGAFDLGDLVDTDFDGVPDTSFGEALATAEAVRVDPFATQGDLQMQREIVHDLSTQGRE